MEQLTRFRSEVRAFALARQDGPTAGSSNKPGLYPERIPLLKACDALRNDLAPLGVLIKVCWLGSHRNKKGNFAASWIRYWTDVFVMFSGPRSHLDVGDNSRQTESSRPGQGPGEIQLKLNSSMRLNENELKCLMFLSSVCELSNLWFHETTIR